MGRGGTKGKGRGTGSEGSFGPASPVRRLDPETGEIIEILNIPYDGPPPLRKHRRDDAERWIRARSGQDGFC